VTMEAIQIALTADAVTSSAPAGSPLANSAGVWSWGPAQAGRRLGAGLIIVGGSGGSFVSPAGTWTLSPTRNADGNYDIILNGVAQNPGNTAAIELHLFPSGIVYQLTAAGTWWSWTGVAGPWTSAADPHPFVGDNVLYLNGAQIASASLIEVHHGGQLYRQNSGNWYVWNGTAFVTSAHP
jgi:hypothetical protein